MVFQSSPGSSSSRFTAGRRAGRVGGRGGWVADSADRPYGAHEGCGGGGR